MYFSLWPQSDLASNISLSVSSFSVVGRTNQRIKELLFCFRGLQVTDERHVTFTDPRHREVFPGVGRKLGRSSNSADDSFLDAQDLKRHAEAAPLSTGGGVGGGGCLWLARRASVRRSIWKLVLPWRKTFELFWAVKCMWKLPLYFTPCLSTQIKL